MRYLLLRLHCVDMLKQYPIGLDNPHSFAFYRWKMGTHLF
ncbi:MAG: hypothetical protein ACI8V2_004132 [Candidatus Latescibacterota bacterium]|jgi:hypothetical protein